MIKNFKKLLIDIHHEPLEKQKKILEQNLNKWQEGDGVKHYDQIDDILVIGVRM